MRYVNMVLCVLMILFAAVQYNDPDPAFWMAIYLIVGAWAALAAFRPDIMRTDIALTGLSLCLLGAIGLMITMWPADSGWWRQEVWWESEDGARRHGVDGGVPRLDRRPVHGPACQTDRRRSALKRRADSGNSMNQSVTELYRPRAVSDLGHWDVYPLKLKVYGIAADGKEITEMVFDNAHSFVSDEVLPLVEAEGEDNGLGFVIIHAGDLGVSVLAHWWIQGSVLCQHIRRTLWGADTPMDTATRPVIACVWELGLINAEQEIWRETMMISQPDPAAYLSARAAGIAV